MENVIINNPISVETVIIRIMNDRSLKAHYCSNWHRSKFWCGYLKYGCTNLERLGHLKAAILIRSENAPENRKRLYRYLWRQLNRIQSEIFASA